MTQEQPDSIHHKHDKAFKLLLSSKRVFVELIQSFVDQGWVTQVDEKHLTKMDKSYILQDFREKEADLVYQLQLQDSKVIFYVLLEMQSKVDFQMPYRLLQYMMEIWRDFLKNTDRREAARKDFRLPSIVPMVMYNGDSAWTACRSFRETLDGQEWFGDELLDFRYILIDIHNYNEDQLLKLSNFIGAIFLLERKPDIYAFMEQMEQLTNVLEQMHADLFPVFQAWIKLVTHQGLSEASRKRVSDIIDQYEQPGEVRAMISKFEKAFEGFEFKAMQKGIEQGIERGIERGIEQGILKGQQHAKEEIALNLLKKGLDIATIAEATGFTPAEVEAIQKRL
ncbi:Rpn family recombination-promoting nuclease/putative transposase [Paenibacillus filicis]|uniref:Rpn family recombination-promoting nuclease/putative transposase n=1 Tax=Paenibacillus filicis TaxID=669464 RepID=UPI00311A52AB